MALTTYSDLQSAVASYLARSDLTSQIPDFIRLAEIRLRRELRIRQMLRSVTTTTTGGDDYNSGIYVWDGIHPIDANVRASAASAYTGWFGMDQFNNPTGNPYNGVSTDVIFADDEVIIPLDSGTANAQRGVYACNRDLTNFRLVWDGGSLHLAD